MICSIQMSTHSHHPTLYFSVLKNDKAGDKKRKSNHSPYQTKMSLFYSFISPICSQTGERQDFIDYLYVQTASSVLN